MHKFDWCACGECLIGAESLCALLFHQKWQRKRAATQSHQLINEVMTHSTAILISIEWSYLHIVHTDAPRRETDYKTEMQAHFNLDVSNTLTV